MNINTPLSTGEFRNQIHRRLRIRLVVYFVISLLLLGIAVFHIVKDNANILWSITGFFAGIIVGIIASRMFKISWDKNAEQVIAKFDVAGIIFLLFSVFFEIYHDKIIEYFISGPSVVAVSFAVIAGGMYGRVLGIRGKIRDIFREEGIV
jgi:Kef-type K+ transport system membrane component KefB